MRVKVDEKTGKVEQDLEPVKTPDPMAPLGGGTATMQQSEADPQDLIEGWKCIRFAPPAKMAAFDTSVLPAWLEARLSRESSVPLWFGNYQNVAFSGFDELPITFQTAFPASDPTGPGMHVVGSWADKESSHHHICGRIEDVSCDVIRATLTRLGRTILHRPASLGGEWLRVDYQRGLTNRLIRQKLSGKPYVPVGEMEQQTWAYLSSLQQEELFESLNFTVKGQSPWEAVEGDVYAGNFIYMAIGPEGTPFTRAMRTWRPIGYGGGSLPGACPPSVIKWTAAVHKTYLSVLDAIDGRYYEDHKPRNGTPYHDPTFGEGGWDGRPTFGTRLLRGPLKMAARDLAT